LPDGAYDCRANHFICPGSAPECATDGHCHCGNLEKCFAGMVCVASVCKVGGLQPCSKSTDCAYGTCTAGLCPATPLDGVCTGDEQGECGGNVCKLVGTAMKCGPP
jgi:hypothetical protein